MNFIRTFTADNTTAELAWESRGVTRSQMLEDVDDIEMEEGGNYSRFTERICKHDDNVDDGHALPYLWDSRSSRGV